MVTLPTFHCPQSYVLFITPFLTQSFTFSLFLLHRTSSPATQSHMDSIYGMTSSGQDFSGVDELLDFSNDNDDVLSSTISVTDVIHHNMTSSSTANNYQFQYPSNNNNSTDFTDHLCLPSDDVAELEWLSNFVHDSFSNFPANNIFGTINYRQPENTSFHSRSRTKRTREPTNNTTTWTSPTQMKVEPYSSPSPTSSSSETTSEPGVMRRCTHCLSDKTPQWRTGPLGPKTLCNACGVRYKSGRLVPEYRPAASPTFVLTQHSNSHRKVMELRRQKEVMHGPPQQSTSSEYQLYGGGYRPHHIRNNYEVC